MAFTPDGKRLLAGDDGGSVSCWDAADGRRLFDVARHSGSVTAIACATDGQTIAAAWDTGTTRTWNLDTRRPASELLRLDRFTSNLRFRPKTRQLIVTSQGSDFELWELPKPNVAALPLNQRQIQSVVFSGDGKTAATGSAGGTARLRDGTTGKSRGKILQHRAAIRSLAFRPDGAVVVTASRDGTARLWKAATGQPLGDPLDHRPQADSPVLVDAVAFSPDGETIATGDSLGIVRLWNGDTGKVIRQLDPFGRHDQVRLFQSERRLWAASRCADSGYGCETSPATVLAGRPEKSDHASARGAGLGEHRSADWAATAPWNVGFAI